MKRVAFAAGTAASFASIAIQPVRAAEFKWKFGHDSTADHPINVRAVEAFAKIRKETGGQLDIKSFPNNQLGSVSAMLTQLRSGALEMHAAAGGVMDTVVPLSSIENLAFAFPNRKTVFAAMDGDLGAEIRAAIREKGMMPLEKVWENGYRDFTNSARPIRVVQDLEGLKLRVSPSKLRLDTFRSMGAAITPLPSNELYTAMQTHVVDGQETPLVYVETQHYYEVQKYASLTHHMWSGYWNVINDEKWRSLPPNFQEIVRRNLNAAAVIERGDTERLYGSVREKLSRQGLTFNDASPATFKAKLVAAGYYGRWKNEFGEKAWSALEKYTGKLP